MSRSNPATSRLKSIRGAMVFLACLVVPAFTQFMTQGLVGYWPFDLNGADASGFSQTAALSNGVGFTNGVFDSALVPANQVAAPSQYANLGYPAQITNLTTQFSFAAWVVYRGTNGSGSASVRSSILTRYGATGVFFFDIADTPGKIRLSIITPAGQVFAQSTAAFPTNQWVHVGGTYDGTNVSLYTNGLFCTSVPQNGPMLTPINTETLVGARIDNTSNYLLHMGAIDDLRVYNRALSLQEMALLASTNRTLWVNGGGGLWSLGSALTGGCQAGAGVSRVRLFLTNDIGAEILAQDVTCSDGSNWSFLPSLSAGSNSGSVHLVVSNGLSNTVGFSFLAVAGRNLSLTSRDLFGGACSATEIRSSMGIFTNSAFGIVNLSNLPQGLALTLTNMAPLAWAGSLQVTQVVVPSHDFSVTWNLASGPSATPASFITQGLVAHWPLDGNGLDASGNGYHAWLTNAPLFTNGVMGMAMVPKYNGAAPSQFAKVGNPAGLSQAYSQLSVTAWVMYAGSNGTGVGSGRSSIVTRYKTGANGEFLVDFIENPGKLRFNIWTGVSFYSLSSSAAFPTNRWVHVAAVYDGTRMTLYTNGVQDCTTTASGTLSAATTTDLYLGSRADDQTSYLLSGGGLDEVRLYSRGLSPGEISLLACAQGSFTLTNVHALGYFPQGEGLRGRAIHGAGVRGVYVALTNSVGAEVLTGAATLTAGGDWWMGTALPRGTYTGKLWYESSNNQDTSLPLTNLDCRPFYNLTLRSRDASGSGLPGGRVLGTDTMGRVTMRTNDSLGRADFGKLPADLPLAFTNFTARSWSGAEAVTNITLTDGDRTVDWVFAGVANVGPSSSMSQTVWWSPSSGATRLDLEGLSDRPTSARIEVVPLAGGQRLLLYEGIIPAGTCRVVPDWSVLGRNATTGLWVMEINLRTISGDESMRKTQRRLFMVAR